MTNRRNFIKQVSAAGMLSCIPEVVFPQQKSKTLPEKSSEPKIWALLLHLSANWGGRVNPDLLFDEPLWNDVLKKMVEVGMNTIVIDLNDAIKYESHPEIAVRNAWSTTKLHDEVVKVRKMGLEPIPKMNFSTSHDQWLKKYGRMVSTKEYYEVCGDLIAEAIDIFDTPRFFHLGMDEETYQSERNLDSITLRQNTVYWGDFYFLIGEVFKGGSRAWVWQDYIRYNTELFAKMMPKSVLQSPWYNCGTKTASSYEEFTKPDTNLSVKAYVDLEKLGYDQVPGGSNFYPGSEKCFFNNVRFCSETIADQRLLGFIQSTWRRTVEENRERILASIDQVDEAKKWYEKNHK